MFRLIDERGCLKLSDENGHSVSIHRTNNPLESYNRKLFKRIQPHPRFQVFVETIKQIYNEYVEDMKYIQELKYKKKPHKADPIFFLLGDFCPNTSNSRRFMFLNVFGKAYFM